MPFLETSRMECRVQMLLEYDTGLWSVSELSRRYGVSRDTFYFWQARRERGRERGAESWFQDRSHAPHRCAWRVGEAEREAIVELRGKFPHWGSRKLRAELQRVWPDRSWPAASTIGDLLKREGLVEPRRRRQRALDQRRPFATVAASNDEWACDFKGWFRTLDRSRVDPLTVSDSHSRYLLAVRIVEQSIAGALPAFTRLFQEYGLPLVMRCDNGAPFGSQAACGLTRLSVWWLRLGIDVRFIEPASPQQNGRHERMHRTLKQETSSPPAANPAEQQERFDRFRQHYNEQRPHEALDQKPPLSAYSPSARPFPAQLPEPWYDADHQVRRVRPKGDIRWQGGYLFISEALAGQLVGIAELDTGDHVIRFCDRDIGIAQKKGGFHRFAALRHGLRCAAEPATKLSTIMPV
jgi:transposase InsO family protein